MIDLFRNDMALFEDMKVHKTSILDHTIMEVTSVYNMDIFLYPLAFSALAK